MKKMNTDNGWVGTALLCGTLWGIIESTIGALLHLLPIHIGFLFWAPIAMGCMTQAYLRTGRAGSALCTALICAAFKMTDLALPIRLDMVVNPTLSILWEGIAFCVILSVTGEIPTRKTTMMLMILAWNTLWRCMNLLSLHLEPLWMQELSILSSTQSIVKHLVTDNLLSGMVIFLLFCVFSKLKSRHPSKRRITPALLIILCMGNLLLQWAF